MVCELKKIRTTIAAGFVTASIIALAACSGDKICEPPIPDSSSSDVASSSSLSLSSSDSKTAASSSSAEESSSSSLAPGLIEVSSSSAITSLSSSTIVEDLSSSSAESSGSTKISSFSTAAENPSSSSAELSPKPFWNDEFNGDAIDNTKWTYDIGTGASGWGNNEKEYYTDRKENAYVKDGILHIRAQKENFKGAQYTSARMLTKGKFAFKYGTVEARIALPIGKGIWPAFWMLGENFDTVGWPACGEIDIIEAVNKENIVYGTNHWANGTEYATYGNNTGNYRDQKFELDITQLHTYKFTWDEKYIRMFVDDFMYHEILIEDNKGDTEEFHKPFFFLLNVAVAGNWPGFEVDDTQFPNEMLVDYIRFFEH